MTTRDAEICSTADHKVPIPIERAVQALLEEVDRLRSAPERSSRDSEPDSAAAAVVLEAPRGTGRTTVLDGLRRRWAGQVQALSIPAWTREVPLALLRRLFPEEMAHRGIHQHSGDPQPSPALLFRLTEELVTAVASPASQQRLFLLDDVENADPASLKVLALMADMLPPRSGIFVFAPASDLRTQLPPDVEAFFSHPQRQRVRLGLLDAVEIQNLAHSLGVTGVDHNAALMIAIHTGGRLRDIVETLQEVPGRSWPPHLHHVITPPRLTAEVRHAVKQLCDDARELLEAFMVLGDEPDLTDLAAAADVADPLPAVEECVSYGLIEGMPTGLHGSLAAPRPAIRDAVLSTVPQLRRRELFHRAAQQADDPAKQALFCAAAEKRANPQLSAQLQHYAEQLSRLGRWEESAEYRLAASKLAETTEGRQRILVHAVDALVTAGRLDQATIWLNELESIAPSAERDAVLAHIAMHHGRAADAAELLRRAAHYGVTSSPAIAQFAVRRAMDAVMRWRGHDVVYWADLAAAYSEPEDSQYKEAVAMRTLGTAAQGRVAAFHPSSWSGDFDTGYPISQRFHLGAGWNLMMLDDLSSAVIELQAAVPTGFRDGSRRISLWARGWLARVQYMLGDWDEALRTAEAGLSEAQRTGITLLTPLLGWTATEILTLRNHDSSTAQWRRSGAADPLYSYLCMQVPARLTHSLVGSRAHDPQARVDVLLPLTQMDPWSTQRNSFWPWQPELIRALADCGRSEEADHLAQDFAAHTLESPVGTQARAQLALGRAATLHRHSQAVEHFRHALELSTDSPQQTLRAEIRTALGQLLRRMGRRREAARYLEQAAEFYAEVRATERTRHLSQELRATGLSRFSSVPAPEKRPGSRARPENPLTTQEQAVVDLVAAGHTNPETARTLFLSEKTVEYHLTRVYAKLGVRSRTELASLFAER